MNWTQKDLIIYFKHCLSMNPAASGYLENDEEGRIKGPILTHRTAPAFQQNLHIICKHVNFEECSFRLAFLCQDHVVPGENPGYSKGDREKDNINRSPQQKKQGQMGTIIRKSLKNSALIQQVSRLISLQAIIGKEKQECQQING